jgi:hypothetical protein
VEQVEGDALRGRRAAEALDLMREQRWRVEILDAPQNEAR